MKIQVLCAFSYSILLDAVVSWLCFSEPHSLLPVDKYELGSNHFNYFVLHFATLRKLQQI